MPRTLAVCALLALAPVVLAAPQKATNEHLLPARWDRTLHYPGTNAFAEAAAVYDDGSGPLLYVGGAFTAAGARLATGLAAWDGDQFRAIDVPWASGIIEAMCVFDDGSGERLFVCGSLTKATTTTELRVAAYGPSGWQTWKVENGFAPIATNTLYTDGSSLYVGGRFGSIGGVPAKSIARYDGAWHDMLYGFGVGLPYEVEAITESSVLGQTYLFAGLGVYVNAASSLYYWDGVDWIPVLGAPYGVTSLVEYQTRTGPELVVGTLGTQLTSLTPSGTFVPFNTTAPAGVTGLATYTLEGVPRLYVAGTFTSVGGTTVDGFTCWDRTAWRSFGGTEVGVDGFVNDVTFGDIGAGLELFVCGDFERAGDEVAANVASWRGGAFHSLTEGTPLEGTVHDFVDFDDLSGFGSELYAVGRFTRDVYTPVGGFARYRGGGWQLVDDSPLTGNASATGALVWDDGTGPAVYVTATGGAIHGVLRWDGATWTDLGTGLWSMHAIAAFDDGTGETLYVGGENLPPGSFPVAALERLQAGTWQSFGGVRGSIVGALEVWAAPGGPPKLYVGGMIDTAGGAPCRGIVSWDGATWDDMRGGVAGVVYDMRGVDVPLAGGPRLMVGGGFLSAGQVPVTGGLARWTGTAWGNDLGLSGRATAAVDAWDDGSGPSVYAVTENATTFDHELWKLTPHGWRRPGNPSGAGSFSNEWTLHAQGSGAGSSLWVGGGFSTAFGAIASQGVARLSRRLTPLAPSSPPGGSTHTTFELAGTVDADTGDVVFAWDERVSGILYLALERGLGERPDGPSERVTDIVASIEFGGGAGELRAAPPTTDAPLYAQALVLDPVTGERAWTNVLELTPAPDDD